MEHTKTPWQVDDGDSQMVGIFDSDGGVICYMGEPDQYTVSGYDKTCADAAFIVTACNHHDDLVRLLTEMLFNHGPRNAEEARIDTATRALLAEIEKEKGR